MLRNVPNSKTPFTSNSMAAILPSDVEFDNRWLTPVSHDKTGRWVCYCSKCTCLLWQPDSGTDLKGPWMAVGPDECFHIVCAACWTNDVTKCPLCLRHVTERRTMSNLTDRVRELRARCGFPGCEVTNLELRREWTQHRATHQSVDKKLDKSDALKTSGPPGGPPSDLAPTPTPSDQADSKSSNTSNVALTCLDLELGFETSVQFPSCTDKVTRISTSFASAAMRSVFHVPGFGPSKQEDKQCVVTECADEATLIFNWYATYFGDDHMTVFVTDTWAAEHLSERASRLGLNKSIEYMLHRVKKMLR